MEQRYVSKIRNAIYDKTDILAAIEPYNVKALIQF